jgi:hypothetical protein
MYTLKELWEHYQHYTLKTSEVAWQLAYAGGAICWLLRSENENFSCVLLLALFFLVLFFIFDIYQYYHRAKKCKESLLAEEANITNRLPEAIRLEQIGITKEGVKLYKLPTNSDDLTYKLWDWKFKVLIAAYIMILIGFIKAFF